MGPSGIPASEIEAWARLSGRRLAPWEFRVIRMIDRLYLESLNRQSERDRILAENRRALGPGA